MVGGYSEQYLTRDFLWLFFDIFYFFYQVDQGHLCPSMPDQLVCAHHGTGKPASVCSGDSGGPMILNQGGYAVQIGIASYVSTPKCPPNDLECWHGSSCRAKAVILYAKVQAFLPWIKEKTGLGALRTSKLKHLKGHL